MDNFDLPFLYSSAGIGVGTVGLGWVGANAMTYQFMQAAEECKKETRNKYEKALDADTL